MFAALIEATSDGSGDRRVGDRHEIIAVVADHESRCALRSTEELVARGWRDVQVKRVGPAVKTDATDTPSYMRSAVSAAEESGFGFVVDVTPIRPG